MKFADTAVRSHRELLAAIDDALRHLRKTPPLADEALHSARKAIKRARAALRLLRDCLGETAYRKENTALRDAGRQLAPARNAKALVDTFSALRGRHAAELDHSRYDAPASWLHIQRLDARASFDRESVALRSCIGVLTQCRERARRTMTAGVLPAKVIAGLRRIHRAGRKAFARAITAGTPEVLHEWRKRVKYLSNALDILGVSAGHPLSDMHRRAVTLADRLGDDHDLAELARYFASDANIALDPAGKEELARLIERRREKLKKRAFALGEKIYAEKPRHLAARLDAG
jgi:CHAD domain-containing protein